MAIESPIIPAHNTETKLEPNAIAAAAAAEMEAAVQFAWESPYPEPEEAVNHVYA